MTDRHKFIAGLVVIMGTLALGAWQFSLMQANLVKADSFQTQASNFAVTKATLIEEYQAIKAEASSERDSSSQELSLVFPSSEDLTNLTRLFDDFATKNNFNTNPFFISNISYREAETGEDYLYVPVTLQLSASKKNLTKFLEYIESSGALEGEVRLMSVEDLTLTYPSEYGGTYTASMDINAYFDAQ